MLLTALFLVPQRHVVSNCPAFPSVDHGLKHCTESWPCECSLELAASASSIWLLWQSGCCSQEVGLSAVSAWQEKNSPDGLEGPARRFVKFGGGASDAQLEWLRQTLAAAAAGGQQVIVCCHLALHPGTCPGACLLWNYEEVLQACWQAGNVVATFSGHAHEVLHSAFPLLSPKKNKHVDMSSQHAGL